jgi:cAMP-dependent protein kinase regulator
MSQNELPTKPSTFSKEYNELIGQLTEQISASQPKDVVQFCFDFFHSRLSKEKTLTRQVDEDEYMGVHPSDTGRLQGFGTTGPTEPIALAEEEEEEEGELQELPEFKNHIQHRRVSVSAESMQPQTLRSAYRKVPKSKEEQDVIHRSLTSHFLFKTIEEEQRQEVVQIMEAKRFPAGAHVIDQGAAGDYFYIVSSGTLDCFVDGQKVTGYERGGSFGELALLYNSPRAATIVATTDTVLWALDRISFRSVIMESNLLKRKMHEAFLRDVPLFKSLETAEIHKIADALEPVRFVDGQVVLKQGEPGDSFYLIEEGKAVFYKSASDGSQQKVNELKKGDYFGELALLNDKPRAATVVAEGPLKCVTLSKLAFTRLLGPVMDILKRNTANYHAVLKEAES